MKLITRKLTKTNHNRGAGGRWKPFELQTKKRKFLSELSIDEVHELTIQQGAEVHDRRGAAAIATVRWRRCGRGNGHDTTCSIGT